VQVSLEQKIATIMYDTSMTSPEELRNHIDDMGFDAFLPTAGASVKIGITGMTYQSCASEIESKIGALPGVLSIQVSGHGFL
jgi:copper chaperone CopZ